MSPEAAKAALTSEGTAYTEQPWRGDPGGRVLVTRGGVHLGFILEPVEYGPPVGLWYIARSASWSPTALPEAPGGLAVQGRRMRYAATDGVRRMGRREARDGGARSVMDAATFNDREHWYSSCYAL